jgi:hypothetical protein
VNDFDVFCHGAGDGVERGQLADAMSGHDTASTILDPSVAIGSVSSIELIGVAHPAQTLDMIDVIEKG